MNITWNTEVNAPCCPGEIIPEDSTLEPLLIQTDWDFPGVASTFGWSKELVQHGNRSCDHSATDGTIDCPECGCRAGQFIESARQFLDENDGATVEDPGYFTS